MWCNLSFIYNLQTHDPVCLQDDSITFTRLSNFHTMTPFDAPGKHALWKHCGKRRNCSQRAISPFPTVFSTHLDNFLPFLSNLKLLSANSFSLEESKICLLVMGYTNKSSFPSVQQRLVNSIILLPMKYRIRHQTKYVCETSDATAKAISAFQNMTLIFNLDRWPWPWYY